VGAQADPRLRRSGFTGQLIDVTKTLPKEILLSQVAEFRPYLLGHLQVIVDDKGNTGSPRNHENGLGQTMHLAGTAAFGAKLNCVGAPLA
jgi:hypothetical protein